MAAQLNGKIYFIFQSLAKVFKNTFNAEVEARSGFTLKVDHLYFISRLQ
jgi:hypothetical protein